MPTSFRIQAALTAIVTEPPDDGSALVRFRRDADAAALATLVRRHGPMVFGVCRRMIGDHHLAEDAFQAVFVVLARRAEIVRPAELPQWLYGTAYRVARRARAMAARRQTRERTGSILPEPPQHDREIDDVAELLDDAIAQLSPTLRDAVVLCELDGLSRTDAAKSLGIAEGTLSSRLAAGRKKLAELLQSKNITLPTGALIAATAVPTSLVAAAVESSAPAVALSATVRTLVHGALAMSLVKKTVLSTFALVMVVVAGAGWAIEPSPEPNPSPRHAFTAAPIPKQTTWDRFKAICGDSAKAKKLYEEMLGDDAEAKALHEADASEAAAFKVYAANAQAMTKSWDEEFRKAANAAMPVPVGADSPLRKISRAVISRKALLRTLFLGSRPVPAGSADPDSVRAFTLSATFMDLASEEDAEPARKLIVAWLKARKSDTARQMGIHAGLYVKFPEMVPLAREWAADKTLSPKLLSNTLHTLAHAGDDSDFNLLLAYRDDRRIVLESTLRNAANGFERKQTLELRDVAVGMALKLGMQNPDDFGFSTSSIIAWWIGPEPAPFISLQSFPTADARDAAHAKAKGWVEGKVKEIQEKEKKPELTAVWNRFKAITGDTAEARKLFEEMTSDSEDAKRVIAGEASDAAADEQSKVLLDQCHDRVQKSIREFSNRNPGKLNFASDLHELIDRDVTRTVVLQGLFLGSRSRPPIQPDTKSLWVLFQSSSMKAMYFEDDHEPFRKLFWAWIVARESDPAFDDSIRKAVQSIAERPTSESMTWARMIVDRFRSRTILVETALEILPASNDPTDILRLTQLLNDRQPSSQDQIKLIKRNSSETSAHEIRDIAAFWLLSKAGRDPHDFGFSRSIKSGSQSRSLTSYQPSSFHAKDDQSVAWSRFQPWWDARSKRPAAKTVAPLSDVEMHDMFRKACGDLAIAETFWNELKKDSEDMISLQRIMADDRMAFDEYCRSGNIMNMLEMDIMDQFKPPLHMDEKIAYQERLVKTTALRKEGISPRMIIRQYFLGTRPMPTDEVEPDFWRFHDQPSVLTILESPNAPAMRHLIANWLRQRRDRFVISSAFNNLTYRLIPELRSVIREFIRIRSDDADIVGKSMFWLLQHGEKADIPLLLRFANDTSEYRTFEQLRPSMNRMNKSEKFCELRDIALAAAMTIAGEDPAKYGFEMLTGERDPKHPTISVAYKTIKKFETDTARDAAHAKAKAWIEARKR